MMKKFKKLQLGINKKKLIRKDPYSFKDSLIKKKNIDWSAIAEQVKERHLDSIKKYQYLKKKPISIAHAKKNMIIYLKNMAGYKMEFFRGMTYDKRSSDDDLHGGQRTKEKKFRYILQVIKMKKHDGLLGKIDTAAEVTEEITLIVNVVRLVPSLRITSVALDGVRCVSYSLLEVLDASTYVVLPWFKNGEKGGKEKIRKNVQ
nr:hypothetical protein [Tanacetum cinerariifolium]